MKQDKVTREDLRAIRSGETRTFELPSAAACDSGKSMAYQMQNILGCKFSCETNYTENTLSITRS
jgi:hypothetical protein